MYQLYKYLRSKGNTFAKKDITFSKIAAELGVSRQSISKQFNELIKNNILIYNYFTDSYEFSNAGPEFSIVDLVFSNLKYLKESGIIDYKEDYPSVTILFK